MTDINATLDINELNSIINDITDRITHLSNR